MKGASRSAWLANGAKVKIFLRMEKLQKFGALGCLPLVGIGASTTLSERRLSSLAVQAHSSMRICWYPGRSTGRGDVTAGVS